MQLQFCQRHITCCQEHKIILIKLEFIRKRHQFYWGDIYFFYALYLRGSRFKSYTTNSLGKCKYCEIIKKVGVCPKFSLASLSAY